MTLCGVIAGAEGWGDIEDFAASKLTVLCEILPFAHGAPSDDTRRRFFRAGDPCVFREVFVAFVRALLPQAGERLIAVDGKTSRGSHDGAARALPLVRAFATEARLVLAQTATAEKSNEITAIPELLALLDLRGATVSMDAMGCQRAIAQQILDGGGHYLLGLKGTQGTLHAEVHLFFAQLPPGIALHTYAEAETGHGRIAIRRCNVTSAIAWLQEQPAWPGLQSIARLTATRISGETTTPEVRYSLSDDTAGPAHMLANTRRHWAIENTLPWTLDMSFGDDACRIRTDNAPLAIATIRHVALNFLQSARQQRDSIKRLRKKAGWDDDVLRRILKIS